MMGYGWGMGPLGWVFMGLFWIVIVGLLAWAVVSLLTGGSRKAMGGGRESPEEILDRRFASGEIDAEEYRRARAELAAARATKH